MLLRIKSGLTIISNRSEYCYDVLFSYAVICRSALSSILYAAPFYTYFDAADANSVYNEMNRLFVTFMNPTDISPSQSNGCFPFAVNSSANPLHGNTDMSKDELPYYADDLSEIHWVLKRDGLPDWDVTWSYFSRARVRANVVTSYAIVFETTEIVVGALVLRVADLSGVADVCLQDWLASRYNILLLNICVCDLYCIELM